MVSAKKRTSPGRVQIQYFSIRVGGLLLQLSLWCYLYIIIPISEELRALLQWRHIYAACMIFTVYDDHCHSTFNRKSFSAHNKQLKLTASLFLTSCWALTVWHNCRFCSCFSLMNWKWHYMGAGLVLTCDWCVISLGNLLCVHISAEQICFTAHNRFILR